MQTLRTNEKSCHKGSFLEERQHCTMIEMLLPCSPDEGSGATAGASEGGEV